jgi:hypothetical protein
MSEKYIMASTRVLPVQEPYYSNRDGTIVSLAQKEFTQLYPKAGMGGA